MITGFTLAHIGMVLIILGCVAPRYYDKLIPAQRRAEGTEPTVPCEPKGEVAAHAILPHRGGSDDSGEAGLGRANGSPGEYMASSEPVSSHEKPPLAYKTHR